MPRPPPIQPVTLTVTPWTAGTRRGATIEARDAASTRIGRLHVEPCLHADCADDLAAVARHLAPAPPPGQALAVTLADVRPAWTGRGVGVELYATAIWWATRRAGLPLVADACCGSVTSPEARRVWRSVRLAKVAFVHGLAAVWLGPDLRASRTMVL